MRNDITIRPETPRDYLPVLRLILRSFSEGTDYSDGTDVVAFVEEIRMSRCYIPELSFVAEKDGEIVGFFMLSHFPLSPSRAGGHSELLPTPILMLAPVAVSADHFHCGIGTAMLKLGIAAAAKAGYCGIILEGDNNYYNRLGFRTASELGIYPTSGRPFTEDERFMMAMELAPGKMQGISGYVVYDMYYNAQ